MVAWRAYYTEARRFASAAYSWRELPSTGVLGVIVFLEPPYREIVDGGDWYYLEGGVPTCTATHPEWGAWVDPPAVSPEERKQGAAIGDDEWAAVREAMTEDRAWPR